MPMKFLLQVRNKFIYFIFKFVTIGNIIAEKSSENLSHFQIKTFGPYEKWEHTYDFSEDGELIVNHSKRTEHPICPITDKAKTSIIPHSNITYSGATKSFNFLN